MHYSKPNRELNVPDKFAPKLGGYPMVNAIDLERSQGDLF